MDIWQYLWPLLPVTTWWRSNSILWVKATDAARHSTDQSLLQQQGIIYPKMPVVLRLRQLIYVNVLNSGNLRKLACRHFRNKIIQSIESICKIRYLTNDSSDNYLLAMTMLMIMMTMMNSYIHRRKIWQHGEKEDLTESYAHRCWVGLISWHIRLGCQILLFLESPMMSVSLNQVFVSFYTQSPKCLLFFFTWITDQQIIMAGAILIDNLDWCVKIWWISLLKEKLSKCN